LEDTGALAFKKAMHFEDLCESMKSETTELRLMLEKSEEEKKLLR
jgi:hypothetical protein